MMKHFARLLAVAMVLTVAAPLCAFPDGEVKHYQVSLGGKAARSLSVYLPDGYSSSGAAYPVLYLLHGDGGNDLTFLGGGVANAGTLLEDLLRRHKAKPLIIACPFIDRDEELLRYFVPFVDATLHTIPKRESRAVAGHSMGGNRALNIALAHPELFSVAGGLSSYGLSTSYAELMKARDIKAKPVFFWLYAGKRDPNGVAQPSRDFVDYLRKSGLDAKYVEDDGDHYNRVAMRLGEFLEYCCRRLK